MVREGGGRRLLMLLGLILCVQVAVAVLSADDVYSGSDAGGRAASVNAAAEQGSCDHDLGYWASRWDPGARVHPMVNTIAVNDGFVQPASILYVCAALPFVSVLGTAGALVLSVAGVLGAAVGGWLLERSAGGTGSWSVVLVGLVGPVAFYGTDVWEHAPAVGCALVGTGLFARALVRGRRSLLVAVVAGISWGFAVTLRTETALVAVSLAVGFVVIPHTRAMVRKLWREVVVAGLSALVVLFADSMVEAAIVGSQYRADRSGAQASAALDSTSSVLRDAVATTVGLTANDSAWSVMALGALFVLTIALVGGGVAGVRVAPVAERAALVVAVALFVVRAAGGLGFVPGALAAAPVAAIGLWALRRSVVPPVTRALAVGATLSLVLIYALQWRGNLVAQWGGRYLLLSAALLTVCGVVALERHPRRLVRSSVYGLAVAIGVFGLAWKVERSWTADDVVTDLEALTCDEVLVITTPFIPREGGAHEGLAAGELSGGCRLLSARPTDVVFALDVARSSGARRVTLLTNTDVSSLLPTTEGVTVGQQGLISLGPLSYQRVELTAVP